MNILAPAARFVRWRDWGPGKVTLLCGLCFYIAMAYGLAFGAFVLTFVLFLIFASAQSALGFVLNEWGDRDLDQRQGKPNVFNERPRKEGALGLTLTASLALATGLPFLFRPWFGALWLAWAAAAAAYSLEPLRFKTRGAPGLAVSFIAQWSLPVLLAFAAFERLGHLDVWALALALTLSGATLEIAHQRHDRRRDMGAHARTFAAGLAESAIDRAYAIAVAVDKLAIGLVSAVIVWALVSMDAWWSFALAAGISAMYLALLIVTLPGAIKAIHSGATQDPYYSEGRSAAKLLHETFPNLALPMALATATAIRAPQYAIVLILFGVWRVGLGNADWRWPLRACKAWMSRL